MSRSQCNNLKARATLNAGQASSAWPVWKDRLFNNTSMSLWDLGFRRIEFGNEMKRIQGGLACVISPPCSSHTAGYLTIYYLGANIGSSVVVIDEDLAGRILAGWSNTDLLADDGMRMPPSWMRNDDDKD